MVGGRVVLRYTNMYTCIGSQQRNPEDSDVRNDTQTRARPADLHWLGTK